ncbi:MAG TPA: WbqC family protein [Nocardioides sp.]|uniref:WbqC family protein n=1 Tax=Nocardioides sp. TaxID=35761 RepID=UPI002C98DF6F|nr:WbqC family protein [Nocardioides sp.]HTW14760.1 WbqC family protein [Nocardioides sp.]
MIVAIHQPNLFPRLKVLQKLALADLWVVLDDVQFNRRDYQQRSWVQPTDPMNPAQWCSLPVTLPQRRRTPIRDVVVSAPAAWATFRRKVDFLYAAHPVVRRLLDSAEAGVAPPGTSGASTTMDEAIEHELPRLSGIAISSTTALLAEAGVAPHVVLASTLRDTVEPKSSGILQILAAVGATTYLADSGARGYLRSSDVTRTGCSLMWQRWCPDPRVELADQVQRNGTALNVVTRHAALFPELVRGSTVTRLMEECS